MKGHKWVHPYNDKDILIMRRRAEISDDLALWPREEEGGGIGNVHVSRMGFQLVPNFSGTIHSFVGATLKAAMLDCLHFGRTPTREDMLKGYLGISRVETKEGLLIVQPYHPMLFRQGVLPGPELLMQLWRGELEVKDLERKWTDSEDAASKLQHPHLGEVGKGIK